METLLNLLLKFGISPAGLSLVALLVTWFFIIFYFLPRIQTADECEKRLVVELKEISDTIKKVTEDLKTLQDTLLRKTDKIQNNQEHVKKYFVDVYKNTEYLIDQMTKINKNINNFVLYTLYKSDKMTKNDVMELLVKNFFNDDDTTDFRFKDLDGGEK